MSKYDYALCIIHSNAVSIIRTLNVLFSFGFEPNERIEGLSKSFREMYELVDHVGFSPMQIVTATALDICSRKEVLGEFQYTIITDILVNIMECLTLNGARLFPDPPPLSRPGERRQFSGKCDSIGSTIGEAEMELQAGSIDRSQVKIAGSLELTLLLGKTKITEAKSVWKNLKPASAPSNIVLHIDKSKIENSLSPGGSDDMTCSICWKQFGMLTRKHRCRISRRYICDECSTRRIIVNGEEQRVSDGQFLLAKAEESKENSRMLNAAVREEKHRMQQMRQDKHKQDRGATTALERLETEENENRDSLFGSMMADVVKTLGGVEDTKDSSQSESDTLSGLSNQLSQTRNFLNERGDKLSTLSDKSDKLVSASQDFAAMAKELNRKSNQGFFSW